MQTFTKAGLTGAALVALMFGMSVPANAAETMCNTMDADMTMEKDMADDGMMKDEMKDDGMAEDDMAMEDDMKSDDAMMDDDTMMADDEKMDDGMAKDDMAMSDDMMTAEYIVKAGDSLWKIAAVTLCDGDRYPEILAANKDMLGDAMDIHPGQVLHIPGD